MSSIIERFSVKLLKVLNADILSHAHVQIGVGHNTYQSGEQFVVENLIKRILGKNPEVIFDVGANIGEYAKLLVRYYPTADIYCFEPIGANYKALMKNTAGLNTTNILSALGSEKGSIKLFIGANNSDGSMATSYRETLETIFSFAGEIDKIEESPMTTLDDYCGDSIPSIDFLKIDVEGHELAVLKGASKLLIEDRINIIQFEFNEFNIFSKSFMFDFYQVLKSFDFYRIMPGNKLFPMGTYNSSLEIFRYQNILAVHRKLNYKY